MNPNPTTFTDLPTGLSNLMGAYDTGDWETEVREIKGSIGILKRGTVLASGSGADVGKLVKLSASTEAAAYGVLLDEVVDTSVAYSDASVTGSVAARAASAVPRSSSRRASTQDSSRSRFADAASSSKVRSPFRPLSEVPLTWSGGGAISGRERIVPDGSRFRRRWPGTRCLRPTASPNGLRFVLRLRNMPNLSHPRLDAHRNNELLAVLETSVPKTVTVKELTTSREAFPTC